MLAASPTPTPAPAGCPGARRPRAAARPGRTPRSHRRRRSSPTARCTAAKQVARIMAVDQVRDDLGVGLRSRTRSPGAFSARAQLLVVFDDAVMHHRDLVAAEKCGCALAVTGAPCVAQRVWQMPVVPARPVSRTCASRSGHPRHRARAPQSPAVAVTRPPRRRNRSRGIPAAAGPRSGSGTMLRSATAPTMPHIC